MTGPPSAPRGVLIFDFDGTVWRGAEPLERYAELVAEGVPQARRGGFRGRVSEFLAGDRWSSCGLADPPADGWVAVARFAQDVGVDQAHVDASFARVRELLAAGELPMELPDGLPELLESARSRCRTVLASNSPASSVGPVLARLGLGSAFDEVVAGVGKPVGLVPTGDRIRTRLGLGPERVLSVGDHYANDIAPAVSAGWFTAYISPWHWCPGPSWLVGERFEDLAMGIDWWIRALETLGASQPGSDTHSAVAFEADQENAHKDSQKLDEKRVP